MSINKKHKIFTIFTCVCSVVFVLMSIFMGISTKYFSKSDASIVFWVWGGYTVLWTVLSMAFYVPLKKQTVKHILDNYSFDKTKLQKLTATKFEFAKNYYHSIEFCEDGLMLDDKKYSYDSLNFDYAAPSGSTTIKLYIMSREIVNKDYIDAIFDMSKDLFDCLNYYDLNIKGYYDVLYQLKQQPKSFIGYFRQ